MAENTQTGKEKSIVKGLAFSDFGIDGNTSVVDVRDGKIIRIRPLHFDWRYDKQAFNIWKMEAPRARFLNLS